MSKTPKPDSHDSGQVRSLTQHRAEKQGIFKPSIYDVAYQKGQEIKCDDPLVAYLVRTGVVRAKKEMDTQGGRNLVTVDYISENEPLVLGRFVPNVKDDQDIRFFAETDCIIGEFPIHSLSKMYSDFEFLRSFSRAMTNKSLRLREALFKQLERNQKALEETRGLNLELTELRQASQHQDNADALDGEAFGLQIQVGGLQRELEATKKALAAAESSAAWAKTDLAAVREREKNAIAKARDAFEYFQDLERRQREESAQFPQMINTVLEFFNIHPLSVEDLMFVLTSSTTPSKLRYSQPGVVGGVVFTTDDIEAAAIGTDDEDPPNPAEAESYDLEVLDDIDAGSFEPVTQPDFEAVSFLAETQPECRADERSGYCLTGGQLPQEQVSVPDNVVAATAQLLDEDPWREEAASSQRGAIMPPPGWKLDEDPSLYENTRDIAVPPEFRQMREEQQIPSVFPKVRQESERQPQLRVPRPNPPVVMPSPSSNVPQELALRELAAWAAENERPTAAGQPRYDCPPASSPNPVGTTTSTWDVTEIKRLQDEARETLRQREEALKKR